MRDNRLIFVDFEFDFVGPNPRARGGQISDTVRVRSFIDFWQIPLASYRFLADTARGL